MPEPSGILEESAKVKVDEYLVVADTLDPAQVWDAFSEEARINFKEAEFMEAYTATRIPLGKVIQRSPIVNLPTSSMPDGPTDHSRGFEFKTLFQNGEERREFVTLMSMEGKWGITEHVIKTMPQSM